MEADDDQVCGGQDCRRNRGESEPAHVPGTTTGPASGVLFAPTAAQTLEPAPDARLSSALEMLCVELLAACPGLQVRRSLDGRDHQVPDRLALAIYRIAREALSNVASHACATRVKLRFRTLDDAVELRIVDDGVGLPLNGDRREGVGVATMREWTQALGGRFSLVSAPGKGCQIRARWGKHRLPDRPGDPDHNA